MLFAGLDLAAKETNPSGLAILKSSTGKPQLTSLTNVLSDEDIIKALKGVDYLAIDAPLISGEMPKGYREAERQLIGWGLKLMTPSFLSGLVKRAQAIVKKLPASVKVIEVHPRSSALMLGLNIARPLFNQPKINKLIDDNHMACANKHQFDGLVASYTAYLHYQKMTRFAGQNGSFIALPPSRNIKLAVFDMDGTLTRPTSSWEHIHRELGTWETNGYIYLKQFLASEITYDEFAQLDTASWKDIPLKQIEAIAEKVKYMNGIQQVMDFLVKKKIRTALISGGLSVIAEKVASDFKIKHVFVNDLLSNEGLLTGKVKINVSFNGKLPIYKKLLKEMKLKPYQVMTVGDTNGDVPLFKNSGLAIAINPLHPGVSEVADYTVTNLADIVNFLH